MALFSQSDSIVKENENYITILGRDGEYCRYHIKKKIESEFKDFLVTPEKDTLYLSKIKIIRRSQFGRKVKLKSGYNLDTQLMEYTNGKQTLLTYITPTIKYNNSITNN